MAPSHVTRGIRISVISQFLPNRSPEGSFAFAYEVTIANTGAERVQLISRHWVITDATGAVREVKGPGVVGEQPVIEPGHQFSYSSWSMLATPIGTMKGVYQMIVLDGAGDFDAQIPEFILNADQTIH